MNKLDVLLPFGAAFLGASCAFAYASQVPEGDFVTLRLVFNLLGVAFIGAHAVLAIKKYLKENP